MKTIDILYKEWQNLQPLSPENKKRLEQKFMLEFNFNSNHLEGNTLTYGQTQLLFMFGETTGNATLRDWEEMKAHNVGLEIVKREAADKERPLTESFIRELNKTILVEDFWKLDRSSSTQYQIHVGVYKTRPNSVITVTGETFEYASPEETPSLMTDLVNWYNDEEKKAVLTPLELAALFHYRYIRIHPFEDGNGRIARLLVNYVLLRHSCPMLIVKSTDKENYLRALHECDVQTGLVPCDGANAGLDMILPFVAYMQKQLEWSLDISIKAAKGENISEKGDLDKRLAVLKQELGESADEKVQMRYSQGAIKKVLEESLFPLFMEWEEKLKMFDPLFTDRSILLKTDNAGPFKPHIFFANLVDGMRTNSNLFSASRQIDIQVSMLGFRKKPNKTSFNGGTIVVQFSPNSYEIIVPNKSALNKLYHQNLSEDEISNIVETLGTQLLDNIEKITNAK